ncbi:MAG: MBL fold metallo-hydrolase [Ruminococcaceae bacterium]|nr:MBL fold metallo-hydrolase [Oscillospiraceae bacterium]
MKITFVGSGHGVPAPDRYCSSAMIEAGGSIYFIDAGAPIMDELLRMGKNINDVRTIFITHAHSDHTIGMLSVASLLNWYYKQACIDFYLPEPELIDACAHWISANHDGDIKEERVKLHTYDKNFVYDDDNIHLEVFPTRHLERIEKPAYGFVVTDKESGKRIVFSGDLSHQLSLEDFPAIAMSEDVDALVCEMAHFKPEHVTPYLEKCTAKAVYFNHVFPLSKLDDIRAMNGTYPFSVYVVCDRDVIEF